MAEPLVPINVVVLHQIGLQRFSVTVIRRILTTLATMAIDIEEKVRAADLGRGENADRSYSSLRLTSLLEQVRMTQHEAHNAIRSKLDADLTGLAGVEAEFINGLARISVGTEAALATVSAEQLRSAVMTQPFQGKVLKDWTAQLEVGDLSRMRAQITMGYLEGESVPKIVKRVRSISNVTARGAEGLVRTSVTHINARAVAESAKANPRLFPKYQWVSVLDNRTTSICQSRAGQVYTHGNGPLPPAHVNCRSAVSNLVPGVDPYDDMGFDTWLAKQSAEDQKDVLGPSRYKLYRDGGLKVEGFTDKTGRRLTLDELRSRDAAAFKRAGL